MATPISGLIPITTPASGDLLAIVDVSDTTASVNGTTRSITYANFTAGLTMGNLTGDVTSVGLATTIAANAVTNAKAAQMADSTIKGRAVGAGTGNPTDLTATQATAILNAFVGDSGSGGTKGLVPAPSSGDATKVLLGNGTWAVVPQGDLTGPITSVGLATNITNNAVTNDKLDDMADSTIKGRVSGSGSGDPVDLTSAEATAILDPFVGDSGTGGNKGLVPVPIAGDASKFLKGDGTWASVPQGNLTGDVTSVGLATTIASSAVTNAKMADMAQATIKGRASGAGTGVPTDLTATQATAILDAFVGDSGSGGTKGLVPAPASGDSGKFLKGNGTWTTIPGGGDALTSNPLSQFAATTSAQLRGVLSDETGTGLAVFNDTPTLIAPLLGTPTSGNLANCTFPTLNQNTTGSAASLSISGQTGLLTFTGLTSTNRAKTVRDAADTILELGGNYNPSGTWTSLTMVTPILGTPTSGNLANCTGVSHPTGVSSDQSTTSNTIGDVSGYSFAVASSETRYFCFDLFHTCSGGGGTKFALNAPAGATIQAYIFTVTSSMLNTGGELITSVNTLGTAYNTGTNVDAPVRIYGKVTTSGTSGNLQLRMASGTNLQTSKVYGGSSFRHWA